MMRTAEAKDLTFIQSILNREDNLDKLAAYSDQVVLDALTDAEQRIWIGEIDNRPAGFIWFTHLTDATQGPKLEEFGVLQPGRGLGSAMLVEALQTLQREIACQSIWLAVAGDNIAAIRFYERHGFRKSEIRPAAWHRRRGPIADALIMVMT